MATQLLYSTSQEIKKNFYNNLNVKKTTDNKRFWKTII